MNYYELTEYLEIEDGSQLQYFEEIADLIESDEHIEHEALQTLFSEVDRDITASLLDDYFNDITSGLPEEHSDMFSRLDQIRMERTGCMRKISEDDPEPYYIFTDRFYKFRNWYVYDTEVSVLQRDASEGGSSREYIQSVRDAIATARAGKISGEEYAFDFSSALDYDIDYYAMSFTDLIDSTEEDDEE